MPPPPPLPKLGPQWAWPMALVAAGVGALLIVWGEKYHRAALAMVGGGIGALLGPGLAVQVGISPLAGQIITPMVLAVVAVIFAHIVWAIVATALALGAAAWALACHFPGTQGRQAAELGTWGQTVWEYGTSGLGDAWKANGLLVVLVLFPAGAVPLFVGLLKPRLATVVMTAALGAAAMVFGVLLALAQVRASLWSEAMAQYGLPVACAGGLATFGMICQYRRILASRRRGEDEYRDADNGTSPAKAPKNTKNRA